MPLGLNEPQALAGLAHNQLVGTDYIFPITHWRTTAINTLVKRFHLLPRDPSQYGQVIENDEGNITQNVDSHQKVREAYSMNTSFLKLLKRTVYIVGKHCIASSQGCDDHFGLKMHRRSVLEYAIWYRQNHEENQTCSECITRVTCHQIAHTNFMAPNVRWTVVRF